MQPPRRRSEKFSVGTSSATVKFVEYFLETKTAELDAGRIDSFMRILPETLPERLRAKTRAKQNELSALRKLAEMKRKPPIRRAGLEPINQCEQKDPLAALLVRYRQGKSAHGTDFFSAGFAGACH